MPFPTTGENHYKGIKNECEIVKYMNDNPDNDIIKRLELKYNSSLSHWEHEGGTKQLMDSSFKTDDGKKKGVHIKHHEKNGTFDWINTTKGVRFSDLKLIVSDFKNKNIHTVIPEKGGIRDEIANIFSQYLDQLSSEDIENLLSRICNRDDNTKYLIINKRKLKQYILLDEMNLDPYCNPNNDSHFILKKTPRAITSRQIWLENNDGNQTNTHLRIRCGLNNGIKALFTKGKSSTPSLKIQQDNVDGFINNCSDKVIINY